MDKDAILSVLYEAEFDTDEASIYCAMLQLGPSTVTTIAASALIERMSTFRIIRRLLSRQVVDTVLIGKRKHYFPKNPESLLNYYDVKAKEIANKRQVLEEKIPTLLTLYKHGGSRPIVTYCEGSVGFRAIYHRIIEEMKQSVTKTYRIYSPQFLSLHKQIDFYVPNYFPMKKDLKVFSKTISCVPDNQDNLVYLKNNVVKQDDITVNERRYIPREYFFYTYQYILDKTVIFFSLDDDYCLGTMITHPRFCESQQKIFDFTWNNAVPEKDIVKQLQKK